MVLRAQHEYRACKFWTRLDNRKPEFEATALSELAMHCKPAIQQQRESTRNRQTEACSSHRTCIALIDLCERLPNKLQLVFRNTRTRVRDITNYIIQTTV